MSEVFDNSVIKTALVEATVPIIWTDKETILFANKKCAKLFGYSVDEIKKMKPHELLLNPEEQLSQTGYWEKIEKKGEIVKEFYGIKKDKTVFPFEASSRLIAQNGSTFVTTFMRDLTKRKKMEKRASRFKLYAEIAREGILLHKNGIIQDVNTALLHQFGYSRDELIGKHYDILISSQDIGRFIEDIESGVQREIEVTGVTKNKKTLALRVASIEPPGRIGILAVYDITRQKHYEKLVHNSRSNLLEALEQAEEGVWVWNLKSGEVECDESCRKILNLGDEDTTINEEDIKSIVYPEDYDVFMRRNKALFDGEIDSYTGVYKVKNGNHSSAWVQTRVSVSDYDNDGKPAELTGIVIDVSTLKQKEIELTIAKNKAEQASRFKSEFLSQMSHEVRTPLNIIINFATLIEEEVKDVLEDDEIRQCVKGMMNASSRITRTIESIILMSELQTGNYEFKSQHVWLDIDILRKIYEEYKPIAMEKNIELFMISEVENPIVEGDSHSLRMIFHHLIDNAVKFTQKGGEVGIILTAQHSFYKVTIVDNGSGIDKAYLKDIFQPFTQEMQGYTRDHDGNGLGLAIVHSFCKLNGAFVKIESEKRQGTTVTIEIPAAG